MVVSPAVQQIIAETNALMAVLGCVEGGGGCTDAAQLVEQALDGHGGDNLEAAVTRFAMERVVGCAHGPLPDVEPEPIPFERHLFETVALAWMRWATGTALDEARADLRSLRKDEGYQPQGGALHLMALRPWQFAVEALIRDDRQEAQRLFRRATELGSQCGTETNPVVQWTYAATFSVG